MEVALKTEDSAQIAVLAVAGNPGPWRPFQRPLLGNYFLPIFIGVCRSLLSEHYGNGRCFGLEVAEDYLPTTGPLQRLPDGGGAPAVGGLQPGPDHNKLGG